MGIMEIVIQEKREKNKFLMEVIEKVARKEKRAEKKKNKKRD